MADDERVKAIDAENTHTLCIFAGLYFMIAIGLSVWVTLSPDN